MPGKIRKALIALPIPPPGRKWAKCARSAARRGKTRVVALALGLGVAAACVVGWPAGAQLAPDTPINVGADGRFSFADFLQTQRVAPLTFAPARGQAQSSGAQVAQSSGARDDSDEYSALTEYVRVADASGWVPLLAQGAAPDDSIHAGLRGAIASSGDAEAVLRDFVQVADASGWIPLPARVAAPDDAIHAGLRGGTTASGADASGAAMGLDAAPDDAIHAGLRGATASGGDDYSAPSDLATTVDASASTAQATAPADLMHSGLQGSANTAADDYSALRDFVQSMGAQGPVVVAAANSKRVKVKRAVSAASDDASGFAKGDPQVCLGCHGQDPHIQAFLKYSPMARKGDQRTPMAGVGCESCHGPSAAHVASRSKGGDVEPAVVFSGPHASPVEQRNEQCMNCHEGGQRINWQGSQMQNDGVACVNCHTVHVANDPVLVKKTQPNVCFACHQQQRAESLEYSHHPIQEGLVVCSDCHNPHGSAGPHALKEFSVNETCYNCHQDKRGPMLWEHQPVREDCTNCHNPHGSVEARLMKENMGFMCSSCHSAVSNNSGGAFGGAHALPGNLLGRAMFNSALGNQRLCLNCHSQIHGSNSPNGAYFFR